jgi:hypothetical protein
MGRSSTEHLESFFMRNPSTRFARYLQRWWDEQLQGASYPSEWLEGRDGSAIASEFRRDAQFEIAQAAFLHRRPNEDDAREVIEHLVPMPTESDSDLLAQAIVLAGATAQKVRATTVAGALVTVFALVLRNILRGR